MSTMTKTKTNTKVEKFLTTRTLTVIAMLSAVATVLMLYEIPLWFAPSFYKIDFSEVPVMVGAFAIGPVAGILIEFVKVLVNLVINGTITMGVGEFANFLIGCALVVPASIIYHRKKSYKTAFQGMIIGTISMTVVGSVLNAVVLLPLYSYLMKMDMSALISFGTQVNPAIKNLTSFILLAVVPFNLIKGILVSAITMLLYKKLSVVIKAFTK